MEIIDQKEQSDRNYMKTMRSYEFQGAITTIYVRSKLLPPIIVRYYFREVI